MVAKIKNEVIDPSLLLSENSEEAQKTKKSCLQSFTDGRRANAWQLARWPLQKNVTWDRVRIHLPRSYLAKDGEDVHTISMGDDINQFVYRHYSQSVDLKTSDWVNFVHTDKVIAKWYDSPNSRYPNSKVLSMRAGTNFWGRTHVLRAIITTTAGISIFDGGTAS